LINIKLFCQAGMSTSLLVHKMKEAAKEMGIECTIVARPVNSLEKEIPGADIVLLGPQVIYLQADAKKYAAPLGIPVVIIPMIDYGMVNGKGVLQHALGILSSQK